MAHEVLDAGAALPVERLLLDLHLLLPGIDAEAGPERTRAFPGPKASFSQQVRMPDGRPVYVTADHERPGYTGGVHDAFRSWLELRGWNALPSKAFPGYTVHLLLPLESIKVWRRSAGAQIAAGHANDTQENGHG